MRRALLFPAFLALGFWTPVRCGAEESPAEEGVSPAAPPQEDGETLEAAGPEEPVRPEFSGDVRTRVGDVRPLSSTFNAAPRELRRTPYASQRIRLRWGDRLAAGAFGLRPSPGPSLSAVGLRREGTEKYVIGSPGRAWLGNYSLSFGQGLIFYDHLGEFIRPAWVRGRGAAPDLSGGRGNYLRGGVLQAGSGGWSAAAFGSRQRLDLPLGPDGSAARDLWSLRGGAGLDPASMNTVEERAGGLRLEGGRGSFRAGVTAAGFRYSPGVEPPPRPFSDGNVFRGSRDAVFGADAALSGETGKFALDAARSSGGGRRGDALAATLVQAGGGGRAWASFFSYGAGYFARLGKGPAFDVEDLPASLPVNQRGLSVGARGEGERGSLEGEAAWASFPAAQGDGRNGDPVFASQGRRWRLEADAALAPGWRGLLRLQERTRDRSLLPPGAAARAQGEEVVRKMRLETAWKASPAVRLRTRYDVRWERTALTGHRAEGRLIMGEAAWAPSEGWLVSGRCYAYQSPEAYLTSGVEEIWDGAVSPLLPGGMSSFRGASGERYVLLCRRRWGAGVRSWLKWDENLRWRGALAGDERRSWRFQTDVAW